MDIIDANAQLEEILSKDSVEIQISGGVTLVSTADLLYVLSAGTTWYVSKKGYVSRTCHRLDGSHYTQGLHNFILNEPYVDHANGNPLDNRRENLRIATHQQNTWNRRMSRNNTSGFKGVISVHTGRFTAQIGKDSKVYHLGTYDTAEDAAMAYDDAAVEMFGEFAALNFPREGYRCIRDAA